MASILRFDNWQNSDGTSIATTDASGNISFAGAGAGKILQVVRATDATDHTITSTSFVDISGMSVTITPTSATSTILVIATFVGRNGDTSATAGVMNFRLTDGTNPLSGAEYGEMRELVFSGTTNVITSTITMIGYDAPATTSPITYKLQARQQSSTVAEIANSTNSTGQILAVEVSA